jgi:hypothetical protein
MYDMNTQRSLGFSTLRGDDGPRSRKFLPAALTIVVLAATVGNLSAAFCHDVFPFYSGPPGSSPNGKALLVAPNKIFGTTYYGGDSNYGVVYELTYDNVSQTFSETVLYSFQGLQDGGNPAAGLKMDSAGALYGTASTTNNSRQGGTVFKLAPNGDGTYSYSVIHLFSGMMSGDGAYPNSDLTLEPDGVIFGTTVLGGPSNQGTVFQLCPPSLRNKLCPAPVPGQWTESIVYPFTGGSDGGQPYAGLAIDSQQNLYGVAYSGGVNNNGTVFELSPPSMGNPGWTYTRLHAFMGGNIDGFNPLGGVTLTGHNSLLGTTYLGGTFGKGVVFGVNLMSHNEKVVISFDGTDGANPSDTLVPAMAQSSIVYGTTGGAQAGISGNVFSLTPLDKVGNYEIGVLYTFAPHPDGEAPLPSIAQGINQGMPGAIFGTTFYGGYGGAGSIFQIDNDPTGNNLCSPPPPQ